MQIQHFVLVTALLDVYLSIYCTKLVVFTFGRGSSDVISRQVQSAETFDIELRLIDTEDHVTKMTKISAMKDYVDALTEETDIVMFAEKGSLFLNSSKEIIKRFQNMNVSVVFSAEVTCEPDPSLSELFPKVPVNEKRFLGAEGVIGYRTVLKKLLDIDDLKVIEDRQYYFTKLFTNPLLRDKYSVRLDTKSEIFQNLRESYDDVIVEYSMDGRGYLHNTVTHMLPAVVQPGNMQIELDSLSTYLGRSWHPNIGCQHCSRDKITLASTNVSLYPMVTVAVFVHQPTPFLKEFFTKLSQLSYPKLRMNLFVSNMVVSHDGIVRGFLDRNMDQYSSIEYVDNTHNSSSVDRKTQAMDGAQNKADYLLIVDSIVQVTKTDLVESLVAYNKTIIAPLVSRRGQLWSNFWGALSDDGYYVRSRDYLDIVNGEKRGLWLAPYIGSIYLIKTTLFRDVPRPMSPVPLYPANEADMTFSGNMRAAERSLWLVNEERYGYLVNADNTTTEHLHNDIWEIFANPEDWREKYIHPEYETVARPDFLMKNFSQPCPDVFWWPFLSETMAKELIEEMEFFGQWSNGTNTDSRLEGGYENVPTRDIHMRQVHWEEHWMHVLKTYVYPIQIKIFEGYTDEPRARMNFVVRYKPTEQDRLRPHHDSSSYTLNIALNKPGIDYEGGGAKFNRYDCAIIKSRIGWSLTSPGRVTHLHEGLPTTKGTRYIFVTFINP